MISSRKTSLLMLFFDIASIFASYPTNETCHWDRQKCRYPKGCNVIVKCSTKNNSIFEISMQPNIYITINCNNAAEWSDFLPKNASLLKYEKIQFRECDLPSNTSLGEIAHILGVTNVEEFVFSSRKNLNFIFKKHHLDNFKNVKRLLLSNNYMDYMDKDLLTDLKNLTKLNLSYNKLQHLTAEYFNQNSQLEELELNNNNLTVIESDTFDQLKNLRLLNLCENYLTELQSGIFNRLKNLRLLNLCKNSLTKLQSGIFDQLVDLKALDLNSNNLVNLPSDIFAKLKNLGEFSLFQNNFTDLPRNLLQNNTKLKKVRLFGNKRNLTLPEGFFSNLTKLEVLKLMKNGLVTLPEDLFRNSYSLNMIELNNNYLKCLPVNIFQDLKKLTTLKLNSNKLETLPDYIFSNTNQLKILNLSDNRITSISENLFNELHFLEKLYIEQNHLRTISDCSFNSLKKLEIVNLSNNHLTLQSDLFDPAYGSISPFHKCRSLRELYLANNNISNIFGDWIITHDKLCKLDLSYNNITFIEAKYLQFESKNIEVDLTHNQIKHIFFKNIATESKHRNVIISVENNPLSCDCDIYDFLRYMETYPNVENHFQMELGNLTCHNPEELKNIRVDDLSSQRYSKNLSCRVKNIDSVTVCPEQCDCFLKPHDKAFIFDCSNKNLTNVPNNIKEPNISLIQSFTSSIDTILQLQLNFSNNQLTQMPDLKIMKLELVKELILSHNNISEISLNGLSTTIKVLELHNNKLSRIHPNVLNFWNISNNLRHLTLYENPWECDCNAKDFYNFMHSKSDRIIEVSKVMCQNREKTSISEMTWNDFCPFNIMAMICISVTIALLGLIIGTFGLLYYKYQEEIKIWLFAHKWCLWFVTEEELDKNKLYDAFVSFSHKDEDFIVNELVPKLESGPTPFKLCLHYRNWLAGEWIPDNIVRSVESSRRTIVVLSPNFLESVWGRMEFRVAHRQALSDGRARVILILYQDVGPINDLDPELKAYINMNTYIRWGDPWFWDKLRYALPHRRRLPKPSKKEEAGKKIFENHQFYIQAIENKKELIYPIVLPETPAMTTPPAYFGQMFMCDKKLQEKSINYLSQNSYKL